jgi:replicative DNA helicase
VALRGLPSLRDELSQWALSDIPRVPTGYEIFDSRTGGGIAPGEVMIFLSRTGVGKTWFAINVLANNPAVPAMFFSLEMHGRYILQRLAAVHQNMATDKIEATLMRKGSANAVDQTVRDFPLLLVEDEPGIGLGDMLEVVELYGEIHEQPVKLVVIDYIELIKSFGQSQQENVDRITWKLKDFARQADVAVIALHQVKRGESKQGVQNQGHVPLQMTDARFGGEMAADYMMGMYKPSLNPKLTPAAATEIDSDVRLQFLKTRTSGGIDWIGKQHHWDAETGRITAVPDHLLGGIR